MRGPQTKNESNFDRKVYSNSNAYKKKQIPLNDWTLNWNALILEKKHIAGKQHRQWQSLSGICFFICIAIGINFSIKLLSFLVCGPLHCPNIFLSLCNNCPVIGLSLCLDFQMVYFCCPIINVLVTIYLFFSCPSTTHHFNVLQFTPHSLLTVIWLSIYWQFPICPLPSLTWHLHFFECHCSNEHTCCENVMTVIGRSMQSKKH